MRLSKDDFIKVFLRCEEPFLIAEETGLSLQSVYYRLRSYGLSTRNFKQLVVPECEYQVILGTVLGDAHLELSNQSPEANARLQIEHGLKQQDYLLWKKEAIPSFFGDRDVCLSKRSAFVYSRRHPYLTNIHKSFYVHENGRFIKRVTESLLSQVESLAMAVWYMDDGGLNKRGAGNENVMLFLGNLTDVEYDVIIRWFTQKGLVVYDYKVRKTKSIKLYFDSASSIDFAWWIEKNVVPSMRYKIGNLVGH